jgi:membrane protein required for colicin V production
MAWVDWAIVIVLVLAVVEGLRHGFFRSVFSLAGLVLGLALAAWNYAAVAPLLLPLTRVQPLANAIAFLLIAFLVMGMACIVGVVLSKVFHQIGLGCLDRLGGGAFGLLQGVLMVTLGILVAVAFFPTAHWLSESKLPRLFFGACHLSTHVTPNELAQRVRQGLKMLEDETPVWLHPEEGAS